MTRRCLKRLFSFSLPFDEIGPHCITTPFPSSRALHPPLYLRLLAPYLWHSTAESLGVQVVPILPLLLSKKVGFFFVLYVFPFERDLSPLCSSAMMTLESPDLPFPFHRGTGEPQFQKGPRLFPSSLPLCEDAPTQRRFDSPRRFRARPRLFPCLLPLGGFGLNKGHRIALAFSSSSFRFLAPDPSGFPRTPGDSHFCLLKAL